MSLGREQADNIIGKLFLIEDMGVANENVTENNGGGTPGAGNVVQMDEVRAAVGQLNVNKAVGIDGVPGSVIKLIFEHPAQELLAMVISTYETGRVPVKWKVARLTLLNKPGEGSQVGLVVPT